MNIEELRTYCLSLPHVQEDVKWGNDLCFVVAEKMFCVTNLEGPFKVSLKVRAEEFDQLTEREGIIPAPYLARYKWVKIEHGEIFTDKQWKTYIRQSYELIKSRLPKRTRERLT